MAFFKHRIYEVYIENIYSRSFLEVCNYLQIR